MTRYDFLVDTYRTERLKVLSVWSLLRDSDLAVRPKVDDRRGRSFLEQMVHQCVSEDFWFRTMLGIDVAAPPLPAEETHRGFVARYAEASGRRLAALERCDDDWWEADTDFFDTVRSRAWVMVRRVSHTSHHRGQQMAMLRMLGRDLYSNYGPTADTGGLMQDHAPVVYPYPDLNVLLRDDRKTPLPDPVDRPVTRRVGRDFSRGVPCARRTERRRLAE